MRGSMWRRAQHNARAEHGLCKSSPNNMGLPHLSHQEHKLPGQHLFFLLRSWFCQLLVLRNTIPGSPKAWPAQSGPWDGARRESARVAWRRVERAD